MRGLFAISAVSLVACTGGPADVGRSAFSPDYQGIETQLLDGDLVNFKVAMSGTRDRGAISAYARCAAAQYTLIRGYGFLRHVRTNISEEAGILSADAVYTISPALPAGNRTIDAEVTVADCGASGIPTV